MINPRPRRWLEPQDIPVPESLEHTVGGHALLSQILARRGMVEPQAVLEFLKPEQYHPTAAFELPELTRAVLRIERAIRNRETIGVWGDFDVDGQTATTILVSSLRDLGAQVLYHIPVRATESHGVNVPQLERLIDQGANLVVTCDTGISAHDAVNYANRRKVDVIITDHHNLPDILPRAYALVDPKCLVSPSPLSTLSGAGIAYKVAEELYRRAGKPEAVEQNLDLAALGLVADLAELVQDARFLVQRGLDALRKTTRLALTAMMEYAEINPACLTEQDIGYSLGPRLNALGRLDDANPVVEFFTTTDADMARGMASRLEGLNAQRKLLTDQVFEGALAQIERDPSLLEHAALVLAHPSWPAGVVGIVASRLVERYIKPTVLLAAPPGEMARGSARSIQGCDISAAIAENKSLLGGFGGHPMAAGLSISPERIVEFRRALSRSVQKMMGDLEQEETLPIDCYLGLQDLSLELVDDLERLAPFGPGNPPIMLASRNLILKSSSTLGRSGEHLQLMVEAEDGATQRVIWWQGAGWPLPKGKFDLAYSARASTYKGERSVQLEWIDARPVTDSISIASPPTSITVVDYRRELHPLSLLKQLLAQGDIQIWSEGESKNQVGGQYRDELGPAKALAIWTTPPGPTEFQAALQTVNPSTVYLFCVGPGKETAREFLQRLGGLIKYALNSSNGEIRFATLAAAMAHREATVRLGIEWLGHSGNLAILEERPNSIQLSGGTYRKAAKLGQVASELEFMLQETAAYRGFFIRSDKDLLVQDPR